MTRTKGARSFTTKKRDWYWQAKQENAGRLQAEREALHNMRISDAVKKKLLELLDRIDPMEILGVAATTIVVHDVILTTSEFLEKVNNIGEGLAKLSGTPEELSFITNMPIVGWIANFPWLAGELVNAWLNKEKAISDADRQRLIEGASKIFEDTRRDTWYLWLISFGVAFYIQRHGLPDVFNAIQGFLGIKPS